MFKKSRKRINKVTVADVIRSYHGNNFDKTGSYTGVNTANPLDTPPQDADDL